MVLGEECERAKPHPDPYLVGAKNIGVALDEVFAVEDSPSGAPRRPIPRPRQDRSLVLSPLISQLRFRCTQR